MAIPVPAGTDAPCDFAEDWCATAAAINAKLAEYQTTLARVYPAIPIAVLRLTTPATYAVETPFVFDTVVIDTAGMTDLDADPTTIRIPRSGRYTIHGWLNTTTSSSSAFNIAINASNSMFLIERRGRAFNVFPPAGVAVYDSVITLNAGIRMQLMHFNSFPLDVTEATMTVAWHSDMVRPS